MITNLILLFVLVLSILYVSKEILTFIWRVYNKENWQINNIRIYSLLFALSYIITFIIK